MMMRMLDRGGRPAMTDGVRAADDDNPLGYYEFEPVKTTKKDASWLQQAAGKAVKMVYLLLYDLPPDYDYRVVFMNRNLNEVIESQDAMLQRRGKSQGSMGPHELIRNFETQLQKVNAWLESQPNCRVLHVDYNEVMKDPQPPVQAVNEFLGGGLDTVAMLEAIDPALYRRRQ